MRAKMDRAVLRFLRRIGREEEKGVTLRLPLLPAVRLALALCLILLSALSRNAVFTLTLAAGELARLALLPAEKTAGVVRVTAAAVAFVCLFSLPAVFLGHPRTLLTLALKVGTSVLILGCLNAQVSWKGLVSAIRGLRAPEVFVFILDMTVRFLVLLGRFSGRVLEALSLRAAGRTDWRTAGAGPVVGTTFLKAQAMARRTGEAMSLRGYQGRYPAFEKRRFSKADLAYLCLIPLAVWFFWYCESVMR